MTTSNDQEKKLLRYKAGAMPLIYSISKKLNLKQILETYIPSHGNESVSAVDTLLLAIYNLTLGKFPLYKLGDWTKSLDFQCFNFDQTTQKLFNDDRFGRAYDKLYYADRASLMTDITIRAIKVFDIDLSKIHNDSTSVKACGKIPGKTKTGLELKRGHSKDHRPDLKQLVYSLSISSDGGVPVHQKTYSGNRTDDTTHIETWDTLCNILSKCDFLYVADSKLCTDKQLHHIASNGGRALTVIPRTWKEVSDFREQLRTVDIPKKEVWRRIKPGTYDKREYFSVFEGEYLTNKRGYKIHWFYSSEKKKRDENERMIRLEKAEEALYAFEKKINKRNFKTREAIDNKVQEILKKHYAENFFNISINVNIDYKTKQMTLGRPGPNTKYKKIEIESFILYWEKNKNALKNEMRIDGVFPLLSTDTSLSSKEVLTSYKYQPKLEKRFTQLKSIHNAAPLLFKNIERIEANMFAFYIALMLQALIEREIQIGMKEHGIDKLRVYPEARDSKRPTTNTILELFESVSRYEIKHGTDLLEEYKDELDETQHQILNLLNIDRDEYWISK